MKKSLYFLVVAAVLSTMVFSARTVDAAESPSRIVLDYLTAANRGDFSAAEKFWSAKRLGALKEECGGLEAYWRNWKAWEKAEPFEGAEIVREEINEVQKKAFVYFKIFFKDGETWNGRADLYDDGGNWKIEGTEKLRISSQ